MSIKSSLVQNKKVIEKYKKKVQGQYKGAYCVKLSNGMYTIRQEQEDLSVKDVLAELFFMPAESELKAWELAQVSVKTLQNLNRTHPLRIEGMNLEEKLARVEARKVRGEANAESRKFNDSYIY